MNILFYSNFNEIGPELSITSLKRGDDVREGTPNSKLQHNLLLINICKCCASSFSKITLTISFFHFIECGGGAFINFNLNHYWHTYANIQFQISVKMHHKWRIWFFLEGWESRVHAQILESKILTFPDFILTKKPVFPDFQKPIKWPGDWIWH